MQDLVSEIIAIFSALDVTIPGLRLLKLSCGIFPLYTQWYGIDSLIYENEVHRTEARLTLWHKRICVDHPLGYNHKRFLKNQIKYDLKANKPLWMLHVCISPNWLLPGCDQVCKAVNHSVSLLLYAPLQLYSVPIQVDCDYDQLGFHSLCAVLQSSAPPGTLHQQKQLQVIFKGFHSSDS